MSCGVYIYTETIWCFAKKQFYISTHLYMIYISRVEGERTKNSQKSIFYALLCVVSQNACDSTFVLVTGFKWEVAGCCMIFVEIRWWWWWWSWVVNMCIVVLFCQFSMNLLNIIIFKQRVYTHRCKESRRLWV